MIYTRYITIDSVEFEPFKEISNFNLEVTPEKRIIGGFNYGDFAGDIEIYSLKYSEGLVIKPGPTCDSRKVEFDSGKVEFDTRYRELASYLEDKIFDHEFDDEVPSFGEISKRDYKISLTYCMICSGSTHYFRLFPGERFNWLKTSQVSSGSKLRFKIEFECDCDLFKKYPGLSLSDEEKHELLISQEIEYFENKICECKESLVRYETKLKKLKESRGL